jgi:2'-hydroxyisoflavone reductase
VSSSRTGRHCNSANWRHLEDPRPGRNRILGRHVVAEASRQGTTSRRSREATPTVGCFPEAEHLNGDRDGNLDALGGRSWDAVIVTSGYVPRL